MFRPKPSSTTTIKADALHGGYVLLSPEKSPNDRTSSRKTSSRSFLSRKRNTWEFLLVLALTLCTVVSVMIFIGLHQVLFDGSHSTLSYQVMKDFWEERERNKNMNRPAFLNEMPYNTSSYYTSTFSPVVIELIEEHYPTSKNQTLINDNIRGKKASERVKMAIVRPFCYFDASALPYTFDNWEENPPCDVNATNNLGASSQVDLILSYSQMFEESDSAIQAIDILIRNFYNNKYGWSKCFENVYAIEDKINPAKDNYIPAMKNFHQDWINGPNRQFERDFRNIQSKVWGNYEAFFYMEGDVLPHRKYWLDALMQEIELKRPFAILTSNYEIEIDGVWDDFYKDYNSSDQITPFRKDQTSANGVYNVSHPLLDAFVGHLESEAKSPYNSIPFMIRLVQLWREGKYGEVPKLSPTLLDDKKNRTRVINWTSKMKKLVDFYVHDNNNNEDDVFKKTSIFHSYNLQTLAYERLGDEHMSHGAKLFDSWKSLQKNITLVISDTNYSRAKEILMDVQEKNHPFTRVVVMVDDVESTEINDADDLQIPVSLQQRPSYAPLMDKAHMDLCEVEFDSSTEWFMMMDVQHNIRDNANLLIHNHFNYFPSFYQWRKEQEEGKDESRWKFGIKKKKPAERKKAAKPVVAYTHCNDHPQSSFQKKCSALINLASRFSAFPKVVDEWDLPFHVEHRSNFCREWKRIYGSKGEFFFEKMNETQMEFIKQNYGDDFDGPYEFDIIDFSFIAGPSATEYIAFLDSDKQNGKARSIYRMIDSTLYMHQSPFVKLSTGANNP